MAVNTRPPAVLPGLTDNSESANELDAATRKAYEQNDESPITPTPPHYTTAEDKRAATSTPAPTSPGSPAKKGSGGSSVKYGGSWDTKLPDLFDPTKTANGADFNRQALPFMFEIKEPDNSPKGSNSVWQILLPHNPEGYRMVFTPRVSTTLTQGGIFEDNIGIAPPKFFINGVIGIVGTTLVGVGKSLTSEKKSGMQIYHEIEQGLLSFYERFGTYRMDGQEHTKTDATTDGTKRFVPELRFYNFCDQEYWLVQINQFTLTRNTHRRHLYQYDIQMTGLKRLGKAPKKEIDLVADMTSAQKLNDASQAQKKVSAFDQFMGGIKTITGKMSELQNKVGQLKSQMTAISTAVANFKNGLTELVHAPLDLVKTAIETVNSVIGSINDIGDLPHEFLNDMRECKRLLMSYQRKPEMFSTPTTSTSNVAKGSTEGTTTQTEIMTKPINLKADVSASFTPMNIPEETIFTNEDTSNQVAVRQTVVNDNDTILTIAAKTGTDWRQIAAINELEYPFLVSSVIEKVTPILAYGYLGANCQSTDNILYLENIYPEAGQFLLIGEETIVEVETSQYGQTRLVNTVGRAYLLGETVTVHQRKIAVLSTGDLVKIPGNSILANTPIASTQASFEERIYGIDEMLDETGAHPDYGTGDVVVAKGLDNIEMQLAHRIATMRGELTELGHPEYGSLIPTFIGKMSTPVWQQRILLECQMTVLDDPRVDKLGNATFTVDNTAIYFVADVYLKGQGNPLQISLPVA